MSFYEYIAIFQTTLVKSAPTKVIADHAKIEFFSDARSFKIPFQLASVLPKGSSLPIAKDIILQIPPGHEHILISIRTKESDPYISKKYCEDNLDRTISNLSLLYDPGLFGKEEYRGWLIGESKGIMEAWVQIKEPFDIIENDITTKLKSMNNYQNSDPDLCNRFITMSRFFSKSLLVHPGEEKLLFLWTILEIFPMKNTSNIKPINEFLASHMNIQSDIVKDKLGIGKLYGVRCDLVHDGKLDISMKEMGKVFSKLEKICIEVMRAISGIKYSGALDEYFK